MAGLQAPDYRSMAEKVEVTVLSLGGEVMVKYSMLAECRVDDLKRELAKSSGFPFQAVRLLEGQEELSNNHLFVKPPAERQLTCVFAAPSAPSSDDFLRAVRACQHGYVSAMLRAASARQRRELLLADEAIHNGLGQAAAKGLRGMEVAKVLVQAAAKAGVLQDCLLHVDMLGHTCLHNAAGTSLAQAQLLLSVAAERGCSRQLLLATSNDRQTALHRAATEGQLEVIELLLAAAKSEGLLGQMLRVHPNFCTPLHRAARGLNAPILERLLQAAAKESAQLLSELLGAKDKFGQTLQDLAAAGGDEEVLGVIEAAGRGLAEPAFEEARGPEEAREAPEEPREGGSGPEEA